MPCFVFSWYPRERQEHVANKKHIRRTREPTSGKQWRWRWQRRGRGRRRMWSPCVQRGDAELGKLEMGECERSNRNRRRKQQEMGEGETLRAEPRLSLRRNARSKLPCSSSALLCFLSAFFRSLRTLNCSFFVLSPAIFLLFCFLRFSPIWWCPVQNRHRYWSRFILANPLPPSLIDADDEDDWQMHCVHIYNMHWARRLSTDVHV